MNDKITILGREYPFLLSASSAKRFGMQMAKKSVQNTDGWEDLEFAAEIIEQSLRDGRYALPWYRKFYSIPAKGKLMRVLSAKQIMEIVSLAMSDFKGEEKKKGEQNPNT